MEPVAVARRRIVMRMRKMLIALPGVAAAAMLAGCGSQAADSQSNAATAPKAGVPSPDLAVAKSAKLTIKVKQDDKSRAKPWTLRCDPPKGTHPKAQEACAALAVAGAKRTNPFDEMAKKDLKCTKAIQGTEVATVTGTWKGKKINATYTRADSCKIAEWSELAALFGPVQIVD